MRKDFGAKPMLFPQPVMMIGTYDKDGNPNVMNAAWGGIVDENMIGVSLGSHKTTDNIMLNKAFTISPATAEEVVACDFVGIVSEKDDADKMKKSGFETEKSNFVNAPVIKNLPVTLECELYKVIDDGFYIGEIKNVSVDESVLGEDGKIDLGKFRPIIFDTVHYGYYSLGERVGNAFSDGKKLK